MSGPLRKLSLVKPREEAGKSWPAIAIGSFVAFGGVLFGFVLGFSRPQPMSRLRKAIPTDTTVTLLGMTRERSPVLLP